MAGYQQSGGDYEAALRLGTACGSATAFSLGLATKVRRARHIVWLVKMDVENQLLLK